MNKTGNKLLHPFRGNPLLLQAVDTLIASAATQVIVVTGSALDSENSEWTLRNRYTTARIRVVNNAEYALMYGQLNQGWC